MTLRMNLGSIVLFAALSTAPAFALQATAVEGAWRNPAGGNCETAYFKSGEMTMTSGGETAMKVTLNNGGMVVEGLLVIEGARRGQLVHPMTNQAMFLVDTPQGRVRVMPMALAYRGAWPEEAHLELCPGTRP